MRLNLRKTEGGKCLSTLMFAEEGQANQGSFVVALKMIDIAERCGADGIEFQLGLADDLYARNTPGHKIYSKREFSPGQIDKLIKSVKSKKLICQIACLSPKLVGVCVKAGVDIFCINAMDLNNPVMLDAVIGSGRPFWLATLMCTINEIDWAVDYIRSRKGDNFGILHGQHTMTSTSGMGVPVELTQLGCIGMFKERYKVPVGFVDHTQSVYMPAIAVAKGADIVMKHLAPRPNWRGPDWQVCLSPKKWKESREILRYAVLASGVSKNLSEFESNDRKLHRRSLFTSRPLGAGRVLTKRDFTALRPGDGLEPKNMLVLLGKKIKYSLLAQHKISMRDLE